MDVGRLDGSASNSDVSFYAALIAVRYREFADARDEVDKRDMWLMFEHPTAYEELKRMEEAERANEKAREMASAPSGGSGAPSDMDAAQFLELLGMEVVESADGYAVGSA